MFERVVNTPMGIYFSRLFCFEKSNLDCFCFLTFRSYNPGDNIWELYVLIPDQFIESKTELDSKYQIFVYKLPGKLPNDLRPYSLRKDQGSRRLRISRNVSLIWVETLPCVKSPFQLKNC